MSSKDVLLPVMSCNLRGLVQKEDVSQKAPKSVETLELLLWRVFGSMTVCFCTDGEGHTQLRFRLVPADPSKKIFHKEYIRIFHYKYFSGAFLVA